MPYQSDLLGGLDEEAMALLLQNIINAQQPSPGYQVYGLPNTTGKGAFGQPVEPGTTPSYYEPPRPAAPNPALADMMSKISAAQAAIGPEQRQAQQFQDLYDPEQQKRMAMFQESAAQEANAQKKQEYQLQRNLMVLGGNEQDPSRQLALMAMANKQPGQGFVSDPGQRMTAIAQAGGPQAAEIQKQLMLLEERYYSESTPKKEKLALAPRIARLRGQLNGLNATMFSSLKANYKPYEEPMASPATAPTGPQQPAGNPSLLYNLFGGGR